MQRSFNENDRPVWWIFNLQAKKQHKNDDEEVRFFELYLKIKLPDYNLLSNILASDLKASPFVSFMAWERLKQKSLKL